MRKLKFCRVCTSRVSGMSALNIFDSKQKIILSQIKTITGVDLIKSDQLPCLICVQCRADLEHAYDFHTRFMSAQEYFASTEFKNNPKCPKPSEYKKSKELHKTIKGENGIDITHILSAPVLFEQMLPIKDEEVEAPSNSEKDEIYVDKVLLANKTDDMVVEKEYLDTKSDSDKNYFLPEELLEQNFEFESIDINENMETNETEAEATDEEANDENALAKNTKKGRRKKSKIKSEKENKTKLKIKRNEKQIAPRSTKSPKSFVCEMCGNNLKDKYSFLLHQKRHNGETPFQCEFCPKKFATTGQLKAHIRMHTGERPLKCKHCDRKFSDYSSRIRHERTHTNERPFACGQCGSAFTTSYQLKNHYLTHSNERAFKCEICDKAFKLPSHLSTHIQTISHRKLKEEKELMKAS